MEDLDVDRIQSVYGTLAPSGPNYKAKHDIQKLAASQMPGAEPGEKAKAGEW